MNNEMTAAPFGEAGQLAYTIAEAAIASRISRTDLYRALSRQELHATKRGRKTLILREELTRFLASLPKAQFKPAPETRAA
jgi:excisionase family DNA binding protein